METAKKDTPSPPYVSAKTLFNFAEKLKQGVPSHIDRSLMNGLSGAAVSQLTLAMKFLKLIGSSGEATDLLRDFVNADSSARPAIIKQMILDSYPFMKEGFDLDRATTMTLEQKFREMGVSGDTLRKCMAFLLALAREAKMPVSAHIKSLSHAPSKAKIRIKKKATVVIGGSANSDITDEDDTEDPPSNEGGATWAELLLAKFPELDPTWDAQVQAKWFESYAKLMEMRPQ
ncbi:hypothetical protein EON81_13665 [bacterium]|nr:MAG: hypothetical protein EON81_13665 [bacterium]